MIPAPLLALAIVAAGPLATPTHHRFMFKNPVPLTLDASRVAVLRADDAGADALAGRLGVFGVAPDAVRAWGVPGWSVAELPAALRDADAIAAVAATLPESPETRFVSPVFLDEAGLPLIVTPDLIVGFTTGTSHAAAKATLRGVAGRVVERDFGGMPGVYRLRSTRTSGLDVLADANALALRPEVRFAEPDLILTGRIDTQIVDDPDFARCWGVHNTGQNIYAGLPGGATGPTGVFDFDMDGPEAWTITRGDPSIISVVFDNGIELDHPDLNGGPGADFANPLESEDGILGAPRTSCDNHGTAVAGTIAGRAANGIGVVGIAPDSTVAAARVFNMVVPEGECTNFIIVQASWIVQGLDWAQDIGARITNHSYSMGGASSIAAKLEQTYAAGMLHFAAAGNQGSQALGFPGNHPSVNSVGAADHVLGGLASFSNFGPGLAFLAPGHRIATVDRTGDDGYASAATGHDGWQIVSGTSFASPYAAGVAALILSADPTLTPPEVEQIMEQTATDLLTPGYDDVTGWGLLNARAALELATGTPRGDVNADGDIDVDDIVAVIVHWGVCGDPTLTCDGDATADSVVNAFDLLEVLEHWR